MTTRSDAQTNAVQIRDETVAAQNTHTRVGTAMKQVADNAAFTGDAPTAHAASHKAGGGDEIKLNELGLASADVAFNSKKATGLAQGAAVGDAVAFEQIAIKVRFTSVVALPAYTYANGGAGGVGATITYNANGAAAAIDGITPVLGDLLLHQMGPNAFENGVYALTQVGTGGTPAIWTRSTLADTSAKILGSIVVVLDGGQGKGVYQFATTAALTIGTDPQFWLRTSVDGSLLETITLVDEDFIMASLPASGVAFGRTGIAPSFSGAGAAVSLIAAANSTTRTGIAQLALGTTTTGRCAFTHNATGTNDGGRVLLQTKAAWFGQFKMQVTKLSDGTDTYQWFVGLADNIVLIPAANCVGFIYTQATTTFWRAICSNASTATITNSAATVTAAVDDVLTAYKNAGSDAVNFFVNGVFFTTINTANVPTTNPIGFVCAGLKSAGTTAGSNAQIDSAQSRLMQPARRAG